MLRNPANRDSPVLRVFKEQAAVLSDELAREQLARIAYYRRRLETNPEEGSSRLALAELYRDGYDLSTAIRLLFDGTQSHPGDAGVAWSLVQFLNAAGETDLARRAAAESARSFTTDLRFRFAEALLLPVFYQSVEEVAASRERFAVELQRLSAELDVDELSAVHRAMSALSHWNNFHLVYQGYDDRELQTEYGALVTSVVSRSSLSIKQTSAAVRPSGSASRIRIGFVSSKIYGHVVGRMYLGWVRDLNRSSFEVLVYHVGDTVDSMTERFQQHSDSYFRSADLGEIATRMRGDDLDILVYTDLGMDPRLTQLAALRLAPVQCLGWGHPVTSGLPTIDYFLSNELIDLADSQQHYTERLVRLPGIGLDYDEPCTPRALMSKEREDFGIKADRVVYLCCQSYFKYLPQYDRLLAAIASRVRDSQFVFLSPNELVEAKLRARMATAFDEVGVNFGDAALILRRLPNFDYLQLYLLSDVFLDTVGFSSFNTALDAVDCQLPIVTCPGTLMRSRLASSVLNAMGLRETISVDEEDYVRIATELGQNEALRRNLSAKMKEPVRRAAVFGNKASVVALEAFCKEAIAVNRAETSVSGN